MCCVLSVRTPEGVYKSHDIEYRPSWPSNNRNRPSWPSILPNIPIIPNINDTIDITDTYDITDIPTIQSIRPAPTHAVKLLQYR